MKFYRPYFHFLSIHLICKAIITESSMLPNKHKFLDNVICEHTPLATFAVGILNRGCIGLETSAWLASAKWSSPPLHHGCPGIYCIPSANCGMSPILLHSGNKVGGMHLLIRTIHIDPRIVVQSTSTPKNTSVYIICKIHNATPLVACLMLVWFQFSWSQSLWTSCLQKLNKAYILLNVASWFLLGQCRTMWDIWMNSFVVAYVQGICSISQPS